MTEVPDEESGGGKGMSPFIQHDKFKEIKWGVVFDEGLASPDEKYKVFWGERKVWWLRVRTTGPAGHGSRLIEGTAVEKLMKICNSFLAFREEELIRYKKGCSCGKTLGDYTTVNLTAMRAGVEDQEGRPLIAYNVIPTTAEAGFDIRIPASVPLESFKKRVEEWCSEEGATFELVANSHVNYLDHAATRRTEHEHWWNVLESGLKAAGAEYDTALFPAATDSRFLRALGIPCFGFSPMKNTPVLLHDHDEFIPVDVFLEGIRVYVDLIRTVADAEDEPPKQ